MIYIGYIIYFISALSIYFVPAVTNLVVMSYKMATEIVIGCGVMSIYPLILFAFYHSTGRNSEANKKTFSTMSTACASIVVSLGLIGTFVGLTQMIEQIAGAVTGGDSGNVEDQIAGIMVAIGASLNSMSFAFLTSVMGVAASVIIMFASSFFREFFEEDGESKASGDDNVSLDQEKLNELTQTQTTIKSYINKIVGSSIDRKEMASIIVSNTIQVKELTAVTNKLLTISNEQSKVNGLLTAQLQKNSKAISNLGGNVNEINNSMSEMRELLSNIEDYTGQITDSQEEMNAIAKNNEKRKSTVISALQELT